MMQNKKIIGITGGSGCGKSYISAKLGRLGIPVIDCDDVARAVMEPGHECLLETAEEFGTRILKNGCLDRKMLAKIVFSDSRSLEKLNEITHKHILREIYNRIEAENSGIIIVDGAVLIESGIKCDVMVGVLADKELRKQRIIKRDSLSEEEAERRISAQKEDDFYRTRCDFIIESDGSEFSAEDFLKRIMG